MRVRVRYQTFLFGALPVMGPLIQVALISVPVWTFGSDPQFGISVTLGTVFGAVIYAGNILLARRFRQVRKKSQTLPSKTLVIRVAAATSILIVILAAAFAFVQLRSGVGLRGFTAPLTAAIAALDAFVLVLAFVVIFQLADRFRQAGLCRRVPVQTAAVGILDCLRLIDGGLATLSTQKRNALMWNMRRIGWYIGRGIPLAIKLSVPSHRAVLAARCQGAQRRVESFALWVALSRADTEEVLRKELIDLLILLVDGRFHDLPEYTLEGAKRNAVRGVLGSCLNFTKILVIGAIPLAGLLLATLLQVDLPAPVRDGLGVVGILWAMVTYIGALDSSALSRIGNVTDLLGAARNATKTGKDDVK